MTIPGLHMKDEDQFALAVTAGVHITLIVFFLLYTFSIEQNVRPSFIEVEFGEFKSGTLTQYAEQQAEQVATRPNPSEVDPDQPQPKEPEPVEKQQTTTQETTKPVDAPDQKEEVKSEEVKTPDTDKVDPKKETSKQEKEDVVIPPKTEKAEVQQDGEKTSGDVKGTQGRMDAEQGSGRDTEKSAPYELQWEGEIERAPMVQPLPENTTDAEATITIRFEVKPEGTIGRIIPLRKMNAELEREVIKTLRSWRFSRLPAGIPQQSQWGTITFHFVLE